MSYSIKCPVCFDFYDKETRPFGTFLCGHCYCITCLEEMQKYLEADLIRCPTCNVPTLFYVKLYFNTTAADEKLAFKNEGNMDDEEELITKL